MIVAANGQIGLARAAYFPNVSLAATGGYESNTLSSWILWPQRFWSIGASAAETLFDFGRRHAVAKQAQALYDAQVAAYRQTVLAAFQEVEDNLAALRLLAEETVEQDAATQGAEQSLSLEMERYKSGIVSLSGRDHDAEHRAHQRTRLRADLGPPHECRRDTHPRRGRRLGRFPAPLAEKPLFPAGGLQRPCDFGCARESSRLRHDRFDSGRCGGFFQHNGDDLHGDCGHLNELSCGSHSLDPDGFPVDSDVHALTVSKTAQRALAITALALAVLFAGDYLLIKVRIHKGQRPFETVRARKLFRRAREKQSGGILLQRSRN